MGNLLGDMCRDVSFEDEEAVETTAAFSLGFKGFLDSSLLGTLPRPATVGCRRERVRFSPVADDEDDIVVCAGEDR